MASTFGGLNTALSALYAQRRGMDVASQNVANANTAGYSRQRADMVPTGGAVVPAIFATPADKAGAGVKVEDIVRLRDNFLETRGRAEHAQSSYLTGKQDLYTRIEGVFAEPSDTALGAQLTDFWAGFGDVANRPGDTAARNQLLQRAEVVADGLRAGYDALSSQWDTSSTQLGAYTTQLNNAADAVAALNQAITQATAAGMPSNEMKDERDLRLMELAELAGATTVARENGAVDVYIGGSTLVGGSTARHLVPTGANRLEDQAGAEVELRWADNNLEAVVTVGTMGAGLETLNNIIPGYAGELDAVAVSLANEVNSRHRTGVGLDGGTNRDMFVDNSAGVIGMTARTISVGLTLPEEVAAGTINGTLDGSLATTLSKLGSATNGPDSIYRSAVVKLGVESQTAQRRADIQGRVTGDMDALRFADSGVNIDEEMTNLISYQKAYEAAARVLTSLDEALDTLINRTGLVGR
ncbi:flagellar hook-associated protein FlgK [Pilimelia terevasa]|uniref:Flagellar hook-associated protein 1 n=1 Tax=Pilimelia terevasa TaxID=53372 RepID=A0A8J3BFI7_9ACTN|nr:flagellar hook-associated protein FlgK [Pilimelia terevasa]GGK18285.1 flagellar hook-associated protein FlgK [Pilimelia terevasa]